MPPSARIGGQSPRPARLTALFWMLAASALFAVMNLFGRMAGSHDVAWPVIAFVRAACGVIVSFIVVRSTGAPVLLTGSRALWMRSLFGAAAMMLTFYVLASPGIALADAATLFNLMPIFVAALAPLVLGERTGPRLAIALPVALGGVLLVVKPPAIFGHHAASTDPTLAVASVIAALCASFAMLGLRRVGPRERAESIALHFSLTATLLIAVVAVPVFTVPSARDAALMIGGGIAAGLAQIAMTKAYTIERAALVASYQYANVLFTALFAAIALAELPDTLALLGMVLVLGGGIIVTRPGGLAAETVDRDAPTRAENLPSRTR